MSDSSSDDGFLNTRRYKRQIKGGSSDESSENINTTEALRSTSINRREYGTQPTVDASTSPIILSSRTQRKTQTKLTNFFAPYEKKAIAPETALKGTPYHGLNVSTKNEYDDLSLCEIKHKLQNYQTMLGNQSLTDRLPDHGKRIKHKIQLLDEALIRVKARKIIRDKNESIKQRLNFNLSNDSNRKTKVIRRNYSQISNGSAKHLDKNNLKDLINSIHSLSIHPTKYGVPKDLRATLYPHQVHGFEWMIERETHCVSGQPLGGIIADEMGLGKTMQMIALMLHEHKIHSIENESKMKHLKRSECTLIVSPLSVMNHWETEMKKYSKKGKLIVYKYHGVNRLKNIPRLATNYNVIITTYGCIQSEWNEWSKVEEARVKEIKDIRKQIVVLQRHERRYGMCDAGDVDQLKKLKMKLQTLSNKKYTKPVLSQICFKRIVLDEAHQIKNHKSKTHKAICDITSKSYWFMTATPIQNTLDDLYAAFHFMRHKYYSNYTNWKQGILNHSKGIQRIQTLLSVVMLRRLKTDYIAAEEEQKENTNHNQKQDDKKKMIQLPPKKSITHLIEFTSYERFIYNQLSSLMNKIFCGYQKNNSVGRNFSQCLKMLLQLRQSCNSLLLIQNSVHRIHSILNKNENETNNMNISQLLSVINGNKNKGNDALKCSDEYMEEIKSALESGNDECPVCLDMIENVSITVCGHRFCTQCLEDIVQEKEESLQKQLKSAYSTKYLRIECPICRTKLKRSNITRVINKKDKKEKEIETYVELTKPSSKLRKLMEIIGDLHEKEPKSKCVVFSQWTSMLDIIQNELERNRYQYCRLDGKMTVQKRNKSIHKLNHDPRCWIMLISLKAGGVGLNLVAANHVIMTDIWWNPAIEDQAFDRVHRIGQTKNVTIHRIVIGDSVEQKVLKLQEKKRKIAQQALDSNNGNKNKKKQSVNLSARDLIDLFHG
eukprot:204801_1